MALSPAVKLGRTFGLGVALAGAVVGLEALRARRGGSGDGLGRVPGMPADWWRRGASPRRDQICYPTKTKALKAFVAANRDLIQNYGGIDRRESPQEFDAVNHKYGVRARSIAEALWAVLPLRHRSYCLDDIDLQALNDTSPAREYHVPFRLPDWAEEKLLMRQQAQHYRELEDEEVPF